MPGNDNGSEVAVTDTYALVPWRWPVPNALPGANHMKHCYDLGLGVPIGDLFGDERKMKDGGREISFERQCDDAEGRLQVRQHHRDINMKWFVSGGHFTFLSIPN